MTFNSKTWHYLEPEQATALCSISATSLSNFSGNVFEVFSFFPHPLPQQLHFFSLFRSSALNEGLSRGKAGRGGDGEARRVIDEEWTAFSLGRLSSLYSLISKRGPAPSHRPPSAACITVTRPSVSSQPGDRQTERQGKREGEKEREGGRKRGREVEGEVELKRKKKGWKCQR